MRGVVRVLVGEQLSSVSFVIDYWQFAFEGHGLTILSRVTVKGPDWQTSDGDPEFRNRLCSCIGHVVTGTVFRPGDHLALTVEGGISIEVSLLEQHYRGAEAVNFHPRGSKTWGYVL